MRLASLYGGVSSATSEVDYVCTGVSFVVNEVEKLKDSQKAQLHAS